MHVNLSRSLSIIGSKTAFQAAGFIAIILFMSNLNALVDAVLHPDIPYFDTEHLVVGGVTGLVSCILFGLLALYIRHLNAAVKKIETLESILPICSNCKRVRRSGADPEKMASWQPIESYITERTTAEFSHGICPACAAKLYSHYHDWAHE